METTADPKGKSPGRRVREKTPVARSGSVSRSVDRAIEIVALLAEAGRPLAAGEIARRLAIPRSTTYEILRTLTAAGCLEPADDPSLYRVGLRVYLFGLAYRRQRDLLREAQPIIEQLRDDLGEAVQLSVLDRGTVLVLLKEEGRQPITILSFVGSRLPVNWSASGRLLVSDLDDTTLRRELPAMLQPSPTGKAPLDAELFIEQVRHARAAGFDMQVNQASHHTGAIAAPVQGDSGRCLATLSLVMPAHRIVEGGLDGHVERLRAAAAALSRRLGHRASAGG